MTAPVPLAAQVRGGEPSNIGTLDRTPGAAWHRPPVSHTGGRKVTTGATRGTANKQQTDEVEAREGERDACAGKLAEDMELGAGEYWRRDRGGGAEPSVDGKK